MKAKFDNAYIKVWFKEVSTSRNFANVIEIERVDDTAVVSTADGNKALLNMDNVTVIEEIKGGK